MVCTVVPNAGSICGTPGHHKDLCLGEETIDQGVNVIPGLALEKDGTIAERLETHL